MMSHRLIKFLEAAEHLGQESAKEVGAIGYMARAMVQASLPYRDPNNNQFCRKNGNLLLTISAMNPRIGLPFGSIPRLLLAWLGREVVLTHNPHIILGENMADFLCELGLFRNGGERGDITRLKEQAIRLFSAAVSIVYTNSTELSGRNLLIAEEYHLWRDYYDDSQGNSWLSSVTLSQPFFEELIKSPVPLDVRAFKALKSSPMAIDIYSWLSYRYSYLRRQSPPIPWASLEMQFGADYARTRDFRYAFLQALNKVNIVYPDAKYCVLASGLVLYPSPPHIAKR